MLGVESKNNMMISMKRIKTLSLSCDPMMEKGEIWFLMCKYMLILAMAFIFYDGGILWCHGGGLRNGDLV